MSSQGDRVVADLERFRDAFDFTKNGLADELAEAFAAGTFEQMETQTDPDGSHWPELSEDYAEWKSRAFPGQPMSELHLKMKDPVQLKGELAATRDQLVQTYGLDEEAKQEACWFSEGNANQPPRPFYSFSPLSTRTTTDVLDARFNAL